MGEKSKRTTNAWIRIIKHIKWYRVFANFTQDKHLNCNNKNLKLNVVVNNAKKKKKKKNS